MFKSIDWNKALATLWHAGLLVGSAYLAQNPKYIWAVPALQALGQVSPSPDLTIATPSSPTE
ncbi:MAG TPA: hypothetical protein VF653_14495 [Methylomirabilota bacterium]